MQIHGRSRQLFSNAGGYERRGRDSSQQCNGNYELQINPRENKAESRCALSGKGILYWDVIPEVFRYDVAVDQAPRAFKDAVSSSCAIRSWLGGSRTMKEIKAAVVFSIGLAQSFLFPIGWLRGLESWCFIAARLRSYAKPSDIQVFFRYGFSRVLAGELSDEVCAQTKFVD